MEFKFLGVKNIFDSFFSKISILGTVILDFIHITPFLLNTSRYNFKECNELEVKNISTNNIDFAMKFLLNCDFLEVSYLSVTECIGLESILTIVKECKLKKIKITNLRQSETSFWSKLTENINFQSIKSIKIIRPENIGLNDLESIFSFPNLEDFYIYDFTLNLECVGDFFEREYIIKKLKTLEVITKPIISIIKIA